MIGEKQTLVLSAALGSRSGGQTLSLCVRANQARGFWRDGRSAAKPEGCPSVRGEGINTAAEANAGREA